MAEIHALWRFQIPEQLQERWHYPALDERAKRQILGLNSARHYGLFGRHAGWSGRRAVPTGRATWPITRRPWHRACSIDTVLQGVGYPTPVSPVNLIPNDNFTKAKKQLAETGAGRNNARLGWVRTEEVTARPPVQRPAQAEPRPLSTAPGCRAFSFACEACCAAAREFSPATSARRLSRSRRRSPRRRSARAGRPAQLAAARRQDVLHLQR